MVIAYKGQVMQFGAHERTRDCLVSLMLAAVNRHEQAGRPKSGSTA